MLHAGYPLFGGGSDCGFIGSHSRESRVTKWMLPARDIHQLVVIICRALSSADPLLPSIRQRVSVRIFPGCARILSRARMYPCQPYNLSSFPLLHLSFCRRCFLSCCLLRLLPQIPQSILSSPFTTFIFMSRCCILPCYIVHNLSLISQHTIINVPGCPTKWSVSAAGCDRS